MTSGNFAYLDVSSIIVDREGRQRRELDGIEELAKSILDNGLINPIVVTEENLLVAGERRLTAHKKLGFDKIAVQYAQDLAPVELHLIELEENVRREELTWQDRVAAVAAYHELQGQIAADDEESWSQELTAKALNMSPANVAKHLMVKKAIDAGIPEVVDAPKMATAANFAQRQRERQKNSALRDLTGSPAITTTTTETGDTVIVQEQASIGRTEILNTDFTKWSKNVAQVPYNFVHCDFPYGINAGDTKGQSGAKSFGGYEDKPETYFTLLDNMLAMQDRFIAPSAHLMFWFSMTFYAETLAKIRAAGWRTSEFPLVWLRSDNSGILPDAQRGPRRVYETALFASRGDRKIVKAVGNAYPSPATKTFHMSEKPVPVLQHFFRMIVDESTTMLDPTCGSGNAVKAAELAGANWSTGIELNAEYAESARENLGL